MDIEKARMMSPDESARGSAACEAPEAPEKAERPLRRGPGRPRRSARRTFTEDDLEIASKILSFGPTLPPTCICGERDYLFFLDDGRLTARCRRTLCSYERQYDPHTARWGPF